MPILESLRQWARRVRDDALALWFAARHPGTPWWLKALCAGVVAYALSPIDLIPDFIPVLGYLDDAILLPGLIWLAVRLLPPAVLAECRAQAQDWLWQRRERPRSRLGAALIVAFWAVVLGLAMAWWLHRRG